MTNLDSITVDRNLLSDNQLANKKCADDSLGGGNFSRLNQITETYLKVYVGNDIYNFAKNDRIKITDMTIIKNPNIGGYLLEQVTIKYNVKNNIGKIQKFIRSTRTSNPTGSSGATSLPTVGDSFLYIQTSSSNFGEDVFVVLNEQILLGLLILLSIKTGF